MCPEIFLYSSLLLALPADSLIRLGNKDLGQRFKLILYMTITDAII